MLGWNISVYRQADGGTAPATADSPEGERLAVWQTGIDGLDWIDELVKEGKAINLGGNGYPGRYTATAEHLFPRIVVDNPPGARSTWICEPSDILTEKWVGKTEINQEMAEGCFPEEWLLIKAWDLS